MSFLIMVVVKSFTGLVTQQNVQLWPFAEHHAFSHVPGSSLVLMVLNSLASYKVDAVPESTLLYCDAVATLRQ